jgi:P-type Cu+ transporter
MKRLMANLAAVMIVRAVPAAACREASGTRETVLAVQGMVCSSCTAAVEKSLKNLVGVSTARADIRTDRATVTYEAAKVTPRQMVEALRKAGYRARQATEQSPPERTPLDRGASR